MCTKEFTLKLSILKLYLWFKKTGRSSIHSWRCNKLHEGARASSTIHDRAKENKPKTA
jgi:hypothetical protein